MAYAKINMFLNKSFGVRGTANGEFDYPTSLCLVGNQIFVVDKQNSRIQVFDLDGVFLFKFGTEGTGNNNFYFPEKICSDGTHLYITDSANHRIKKHDLLGVFVLEFGTLGTGNNNFDYPKGIDTKNGFLYIADTQNNRIKIHSNTGTFVNEIAGFNFPEGVCISALNEIVICDSFNQNVKIYNLALVLLHTSTFSLQYPSDIASVNGILAISDKQDNRIIFCDNEGIYISDTFLDLNFPMTVFYKDASLYVVNYSLHEVSIFDFTITTEFPKYSNKLLKLTKQLYPTGRAWWMRKGGIFEKIHEALTFSESLAIEKIRSINDSILADNLNFSLEDATNWERALGLINNPENTFETRKLVILRKYKHPGDVLYRQSSLYLQGQLQSAGFMVWVHENKFGDPPVVYDFVTALYGNVKYNAVNYGFSSSLTYKKILNSIYDETDDFGDLAHQRAVFFIGGEFWPARISQPKPREKEFRELVLKLKPAHMAAISIVDFISGGVGIGSGSIGYTFVIK